MIERDVVLWIALEGRLKVRKRFSRPTERDERTSESDERLLEAAQDLYASKWKAFVKVTLPLSLPGIVAGTLLTFIPAAGDFINAQLLGSPQNHMIGNVIQSKFLELTDYPAAAAMSFILMAGILVAVFLYARAVGTEQLTGTPV